MAARKFVIVPVGSGYPFFHGIDLSDFNGIRSKYHRKINFASRGSMTSDIRIDFTQQIIDKLGGLPRCTRFATRTVPYGRDFEAEFTANVGRRRSWWLAADWPALRRQHRRGGRWHPYSIRR